MDPRPELLRYLELVNATVQAGLTFSKNVHDIERFHLLRRATEQMLAKSLVDADRDLAAWLTADSGYPTPKIDVRALIVDERHDVLLVREASDGAWTLPGGWCDIGESPREAVERECLEETGLTVRAVRLLALWDKLKHPHPPQIPHAYKAFFLCRVEGGRLLTSTAETTGAAYYLVDALPALSEHRVLGSQLRTLLEHVRLGRTETLFD
ncbi:MAG: NUDIX hydrolase N-terminal domain-containing protein [Burkholderiaceae bacterium]